LFFIFTHVDEEQKCQLILTSFSFVVNAKTSKKTHNSGCKYLTIIGTVGS